MKGTIKKDELLTVLRKNREQHHAIYLEALEGYREQAQKELNDLITQLANSRALIPVNLRLQTPSDYTSEYDKVIGLLEMMVEDEVELGDSEYRQYVMDDWGWKENFLASNSFYSVTARNLTRV